MNATKFERYRKDDRFQKPFQASYRLEGEERRQDFDEYTEAHEWISIRLDGNNEQGQARIWRCGALILEDPDERDSRSSELRQWKEQFQLTID